jgi:hypothetical protein
LHCIGRLCSLQSRTLEFVMLSDRGLNHLRGLVALQNKDLTPYEGLILVLRGFEKLEGLNAEWGRA